MNIQNPLGSTQTGNGKIRKIERLFVMHRQRGKKRLAALNIQRDGLSNIDVELDFDTWKEVVAELSDQFGCKFLTRQETRGITD